MIELFFFNYSLARIKQIIKYRTRINYSCVNSGEEENPSVVGVQSSLRKCKQRRKEGARKLNREHNHQIGSSFARDQIHPAKRILMIYPIDRASDFHRVDSSCDCALSLKERIRETIVKPSLFSSFNAGITRTPRIPDTRK